jgi:hypothetical protein
MQTRVLCRRTIRMKRETKKKATKHSLAPVNYGHVSRNQGPVLRIKIRVIRES